MLTKVFFLLCNTARTAFFKNGQYTVPDPFRATPFSNKDEAKAWQHTVLSSFQKEVFTEIEPVEITIKFLKEKK